MDLPAGLDLTAWLRLVLLNALRPEKLLFCVAQMVNSYLGQKFVESPPFDLEGSFEDSEPLMPLIFVLSSGSDPTVLFFNFAEEKGFAEKKKLLSLGQDQGPKAEAMINNAIKEGEWVYLQNCHLCASWMPGLEKILEELAQKELHEDYRLWLTTMPALHFPTMVLQSGLKIVKEPPKGMRANLRDTIVSVLPESLWEGCTKEYQWKKLVFSLVFFHGLIQERRKFGPLGWNVRYEFNNSDLSTALKYLKTYLEDFEEIPWPAVNYILGAICYGGRVTDFLDLRCVMCMLKTYLNSDALEQGHSFTPDGVYYPPEPGPLNGVFDYLSTLPMYESPEVFGLHPNADINLQLAESNSMKQSILDVIGGGGGGGGSSDEVVDNLAQELLGKLPALIDKRYHHPSIFELTKAGIVASLTTVLVQEIDRFNILMKRIKSTLLELRRAIAGEVILSFELEKMYNDFVFLRVPALWSKAGYPSLKPLGSWYDDFILRVAFLQKWLLEGRPPSYWISGFFFPQGFMTGVLQTHSRRFIIPIDEITYATHVTEWDSPDMVKEGADIGVYIHGMYVEGARWDRGTKTVAESHKGELYDSLPVVWLECLEKVKKQADETLYAAPLYKISTRAGVLSTTGLSTNHIMNLELPSGDHHPNHWIMRGAALLSMLNN
jgi:dynein heavy chain